MAFFPRVDGTDVPFGAPFHPAWAEARVWTVRFIGNSNCAVLDRLPAQVPELFRQPRGGADLHPPHVAAVPAPVRIYHHRVPIGNHSLSSVMAARTVRSAVA